MLHPASPIYEVLIGVFLLTVVFGSVLSIPTFVALCQDKKEEEERRNNFDGEKNETRV